MTNSQPYTIKTLADTVGAEIIGHGESLIHGLATLEEATASEISFFSSLKYKKDLFNTQAACVLIRKHDFSELGENISSTTQYLIVDDPYLAYAKISQLFQNDRFPEVGIHPSAVIGEEVSLGDNIYIGPNVVINNHCDIGDNVRIGSNVSIGNNVTIGTNCILYPNVSLYNDVHLGRECVLHSMCVIGADGFGFAPSSTGWQKIHQLGGVRVGASVEVGAGTTIDRGALSHTEIGDGVKIDNQVQIAHNVKIGDHTAIAAAVAIAGSATIGKRCTIAGAVGIVGHVNIVDDVHVTAMTMVTKSINVSGSYSSGVPMNETRNWKKNAVRFNQLDAMARQLKSMQKINRE